LATATAENTQLVAKLKQSGPTDRDVKLAAEVMEIWDPRGKLFNYLEISFDAKRWRGDDVQPMFAFGYEYEHRFFDDQTVQEAFVALQSASAALVRWLSHNGFAERENNLHRADGDPFIYSVPGVGEIGPRNYDALRDAGEDASYRLLEASRDFEKVARLRGL
jgi:hypothetical protein